MTPNNTNGTTRASRAPRSRLAGFALAVLIGGLAIGWINLSVRDSLRALERDFAAVQTQRLYLAVNVRDKVLTANDQLLDFQVTGDRLQLVRYRETVLQLRRLLDEHTQHVVVEEERVLQRQLADAVAHYLREMELLEERSGVFSLNAGRARMEQAGKVIETSSEPVLRICGVLMDSQSRGLAAFIEASQGTVESLRQWIKLSLVVLLVLSVAVAVLVYRGMIAPLQDQLSETKAVIARQEKLAALGGLAAGVAHEIRNPLTAIKFRLFSLKRSLPAEMADNEDAGVIAGEINRLERIVRDFLEFARPSEPEPARVAARQLLEEVAALMRPQLEEAGVELQVADTNGLWLRVDFQQIKQVLINLIRNAAESIEGSGTVMLSARTDAAPLVGKRVAVAVIEVSDTGKGIPPEIRQRLFDPFFTTKDAGTGLGLSIAARIVEKHAGELQYEPRRTGGTTFRVVLPTTVEDESAHTPD